MLKVAILMGSDSDAEVMKQAWEVLAEFGVEADVRVLSAHRTPDETVAFAKSAKENDIGVIIAAAGGAAHLAGVIAAVTSVPVIGVPIMSKSTSGLDSLLSMVQMPKGIPVATVAIDGAKNAGLLALRILAVSDEEIYKKYEQFRLDQSNEVKQKDQKLRQKLGLES
jgi:5-(carboxyamino)imidazole ribonucleotide mutase